MIKPFICSIMLFSLALIPLATAEAGLITADTVWQGEVVLTGDVLVPQGVTLTVRPGTSIKVAAAESTKTDPEFLSPLTEILVRGKIRVEGSAAAPVSFSSLDGDKSGNWAGLLLDGGEAFLSNCTISGAESALYNLDGSLEAESATISGNRYGITVITDSSKTILKNSRISGNDYGLVTMSKAEPVVSDTLIAGNRKKDFWKENLQAVNTPTVPSLTILPALSRSYKNEALLGDTIWNGRIRIEGNVRIPEGSRLLIAPGTVVEFAKSDTNGDGIGENGILVQGTFIAKGTKNAPIYFRSAEKNRKMGDWDSINIMNSDKAENLLENCIFEDAYRGLHFHFSTVQVSKTAFRNNYRGIQFQESSVEIRNCDFMSNKSGVQGRDSYIRFIGNRLLENHQGVNFFRCNLEFSGNVASGNQREGIRIREGSATVEENRITGNRFGMMIADTYYGSVRRNVIANSAETALAMKNVDNLELLENYLGRNGANGLNLQDARATIKGNLIACNDERGIGIISFAGSINNNNIVNNRLFAIDLEGKEDVDAGDNWWGGDDPAAVVFDQRKDPARGRVLAGKPALQPVLFTWPLQEISGEIHLAGAVRINDHPTVPQGASLVIAPGSTIRFAPEAGIIIHGKLTSAGTTKQPIRFTSLAGSTPGAWDSIMLEQATDSTISHALIEFATWGIHSHFTNLELDHMQLQHNIGGMRFRSGPVHIKNSVFRDNKIGIRSYIGNGVIEENLITGNEIGLFVREKGGGLTIRKNNFSANSDYNIRSGDFNTEDIPAADNWWGTTDPAATFFDGRQEEGVGKVLFEPFLSAPFPLDQAGVQ